MSTAPAATLLQRDTARNRLIGILLVSGTALSFAVLDASAKWLIPSMPVLQIVFLRFLGHTVFTAVALGPRQGLALWQTRRPGLQVVRALLLPLMTALNFWALQYLQLTETGAIAFIAPIIVALLGTWLLGERLDRGRWTAIVVGFVGVLIILQPGGRGFHPALLVSLAQASMYASFIVLTRYLAATERPEATNFLSGLGATLAIAPFAIQGWVTPASPQVWIVVALTGLSGGFGHYLLAAANRFAPASTVSPFLYQQILYMALLGYLVFGDVPRATVVVGAAIVIASGLYLVARERGVRSPA